MKPILTPNTTHHTLRLRHGIISLSSFASTEFSAEITGVDVVGGVWERLGIGWVKGAGSRSGDGGGGCGRRRRRRIGRRAITLERSSRKELDEVVVCISGDAARVLKQ